MTIDVDKQIAFWRKSAEEDMGVARGLVQRNHIRHGLSFAHLGLEKALKAHVYRRTKDIPPRLHNLIRLAELAGLNPQSVYVDILAEMNSFNIEGRYPDALSLPPSQDEALEYMNRANEVFEWLIKLL